MKKNFVEYPPITLLKQISAHYPDVWIHMREFHIANGQRGMPKWIPECYAPIGAAIAVTTRGRNVYPRELDMQTMADAQCIAALAPWRLDKEVFVLDKEMEALLCSHIDDLDIPSQILYRLPYMCFYIEFNDLFLDGESYHGVFVHIEDDPVDNAKELRLLFLRADCSYYGFPIHINAQTMKNNVLRTAQEAYKITSSLGRYDQAREMIAQQSNIDNLTAFLSKTLQAVLYVCANNADIMPSSEQALITKRTNKIKDRYAEIKKWSVGFRVGTVIKNRKEDSKNNEHGTGTHASPQPHVRRAHWHHYWIGPLHDTDRRQLILKWIAPTFIGDIGDQEWTTPLLFHKTQDSE